MGGGAQFAASDATQEVQALVERLGGPTDADGLARLVAGLSNVAALLLDSIEKDISRS